MGFAEFLAEKKKGKQSVEPPKGKWVAPEMQKAPGFLDLAGKTLGNVFEAGKKEAPGFLQSLAESSPIVRAVKRGIEKKPLEAVQALNPVQNVLDLASGLWKKGAGIVKDPGYYGDRPLEGTADILGLLGGLKIGAGKVPIKGRPTPPPIEPPISLPKPRMGPAQIPGYNRFENAPPIEQPPTPNYQFNLIEAMKAPQPLPVPAKSAGPFPSSRISPVQALPGTRSMAELAGEATSSQVFEMTPEQAQAKLAGEPMSPDMSGLQSMQSAQVLEAQRLQNLEKLFQPKREFGETATERMTPDAFLTNPDLRRPLQAGKPRIIDILQDLLRQGQRPWKPTRTLGGPPEPGPLATIRRLSPEALDALMELLKMREAP